MKHPTDTPRLRAVADKRADTVTPSDIREALAALARDPRVSSVQYVGNALQGRPSFSISATDFAEGDMCGVFSVGRILYASFETPVERAERILERERERADAFSRAKYEREAHEVWRQRNFDRVVEAGIRPETLAWYANAVFRGSYIAPDDPAHDAFAWYEQEIVQDGDRPFDLAFYLANFTR